MTFNKLTLSAAILTIATSYSQITSAVEFGSEPVLRGDHGMERAKLYYIFG